MSAAANSAPLTETERTRLHRRAERGSFDRHLAYQILDEGLICHVSFMYEAQPVVLPMAYVRVGDQLYLHGSSKNRMLGVLAGGAPVCVAVTLLDGLVLARSQFHHSMNYRSVVLFGAAHEITDPEHKQRVLGALCDHLVPGRSAETRPGTRQELGGTQLLGLPIAEASVKRRTGPPIDGSEDLALPHWSGVVPVETHFGVPLADPTLRSEAAPSVAVQRLLAGGGRGAAPPDGNAAPEAADQQALLHSQRARASEPAQRGAPSR
jgi:nitroimidazol reductase NimA-like FMN-containing flavoprotein (pyridoxamine 5'-phosphate oxidase superfamily)